MRKREQGVRPGARLQLRGGVTQRQGRCARRDGRSDLGEARCALMETRTFHVDQVLAGSWPKSLVAREGSSPFMVFCSVRAEARAT